MCAWPQRTLPAANPDVARPAETGGCALLVAVAEHGAGHLVAGVQQVVQGGVEVVGGGVQGDVLGLVFST